MFVSVHLVVHKQKYSYDGQLALSRSQLRTLCFLIIFKQLSLLSVVLLKVKVLEDFIHNIFNENEFSCFT